MFSSYMLENATYDLAALPMSMPAALWRVIVWAVRDLVGLRLTLRLRWAIAFSIFQLEKMAPNRVHHFAHTYGISAQRLQTATPIHQYR
ncbi:MAG: hypothetical protein K8R50_09060 [Betaproteobacteria bacterium]|nr:hypothetical protein [Betaproteobacteria bacterium]